MLFESQFRSDYSECKFQPYRRLLSGSEPCITSQNTCFIVPGTNSILAIILINVRGVCEDRDYMDIQRDKARDTSITSERGGYEEGRIEFNQKQPHLHAGSGWGDASRAFYSRQPSESHHRLEGETYQSSSVFDITIRDGCRESEGDY